MAKLDVEQDKERKALDRRLLLQLNQLSRLHVQDARRKLLTIPDDVWDQAMANDAEDLDAEG